MAKTADQAMQWLRLRLQPEIDPRLTDTELQGLLTVAAVVDASGRPPSDEEWTPTYSENRLNAAAAEGFMVKLAKLNADKTHSDEGKSWSPEQRRRDLMDQATEYRRKVVASQQVRPFRHQRSELTVGELVN